MIFLKHFKKLPILGLLVFLFISPLDLQAACHKSTHTEQRAESNTIHTYGGGQLFDTVFTSISLFMYGNTKSGLEQTFLAILKIALAIGGFCCISLAFLKEKIEPLIRQFFLPAVAIMSLFTLPKTTIYIQDHLTEQSPSSMHASFFKVENVPFFLGKFSAIVSSTSYAMTAALERIMHTVDDKIYNWTGHIYAGQNLFSIKKTQISDPVLEDNFREFCRECVFRDLGIGLYTKNELIHSPNLLDFLQKNTSNIRTINYKYPAQKNEDSPTLHSSQNQFLTCQTAISKMIPDLQLPVSDLKRTLLGEVGDEKISSDYSFLIKEKENGKKDLDALIKQQIAIQILKEEVPGTLNSFSAKRAELLQRENQKTLGAMGVFSLIYLHNILEATLYLVFPLILITCLLSFGIRPLIQFSQFILFINIWPLFFVIINYQLSLIWSFRTQQKFGTGFNYSLFTSEGMTDLYAGMESLAAVMLSLIPLLSWMIIKGGVSQIAQFASSMMSPAQTAASAVAAEKVYGNYGFGNVNLENTNAHNAQAFRQTYSGALSYGSVSLDSGTQTVTYTPGEKGFFVRQGDSYLREGITRSHAFSNAVQDSLTHSQSAVSETSKMTSDNLNDSVNNATGLVKDLSKQFQKGDNFNTQTSSGLQEATQYMQGVANDYAQSKGITYDEAMREVFSSGIGFSLGIKGSIDGSYQDGASSVDSNHVSQKAFDGQSFQKHFQTLTNASSGEIATILGGEGLRLHEDLSRSLNQTASSSEQWRAAKQKHDAIAELQSYSENQSVSVQQNLNQRFVEFLHEKYQGDTGQITQALNLPGESPEKMSLFKEFTQDFFPKNMAKQTDFSAETAYDRYKTGLRSVEDVAHAYPTQSSIHKDGTDQIGFSFGATEGKVASFKNAVARAQQGYQSSFENQKDGASYDYQSLRSSVESSAETSIQAKFGESSAFSALVDKGLNKAEQLGNILKGSDRFAVQNYRELYTQHEEDK